MGNYIDAVEAAADNYKLLSEEGKVRVIEMTLPPGVIDNEHSHHHEVVYFLKGGNLRIHVDGDAMEADIPDGHVMHHGPWTHRVENIGTTTVKAIIFETMP
jgi:mannose-6-phosphate isomerase-like protein (cupin superfamily)